MSDLEADKVTESFIDDVLAAASAVSGEPDAKDTSTADPAKESDQPSSSTNITSLPSELLVEILLHMPYDPTDLQNLRLTQKNINDVIKESEAHIVKQITAKDFCDPQSLLENFPDLKVSLASRKGDVVNPN